MDTAVHISDAQPVVFFSRRFGLSGLTFSTFGLALALFAPLIEDSKHPPPKDLSTVLSETAEQIKDKLTKPEVPVEARRRISLRTLVMISASVLGFLGAALGTAAWGRRENIRIAGLAVAVGLAAIAWNFFLTAVIAAVALFLLAWILSHFAHY